MAMFMEQKINGQSIMMMTFTEAETDPEIEQDIFTLK
jgi:hypothetical protein